MFSKVIRDRSDFIKFASQVKSKDLFAYPIYSDTRLQPVANRVSAVFFNFENEFRIFGVNHTDLPHNDVELLRQLECNIYAPNKKAIWHLFSEDCLIKDLQSGGHYDRHKFPSDDFHVPLTIRNMRNIHSDRRNLNDVVPISKLLEIADSLHKEYSPFKDHDGKFINNVSSEVYAQIESTGVKVNDTLFIKHFGWEAIKHTKDRYAFCNYNLYTKTGRPSNSNGTVNFSALNKSDGSRTAFISRFDVGSLVQFDFDSFHLRLIAKAIGYPLSNDSVHMQLAKSYFPNTEITKELYERSKIKTFTVLYSTAPYTGDHPFLKKIADHKKYVYSNFHTMKEFAHILLPDSADESVVFNYYIQFLEYVYITLALSKIVHMNKSYKSKIIMTTYDSVLVDFHPDDGVNYLTAIRAGLEGTSFPVHMEAGKNYGDMQVITDLKELI